MRRKLKLADLDAVIEECQNLLRTGYVRNGNWTLAQICNHLRLTIDANVEGYPSWMTILGFPLRPFLRAFLLNRLLRGDSPAGIRTASQFVPPIDLDDAKEVDALVQSIKRFHNANKLNPHPGFGNLSKPDFEAFHAAHAAHHLGFLKVQDSATGKAT